MKRAEVPEMMPLNFFIGEWRTEGEIHDDVTPSKKRVFGQDFYECVAGGHFLLHRVDVMMANEHVEVVELIGRTGIAHDQEYTMHSFDNQGKVTIMKGYLEKPDLFRIEGEGSRSILKVVQDGKTLMIAWEQLSQGVWKPWITMKLSKIM
jgi:hypothetical protein